MVINRISNFGQWIHHLKKIAVVHVITLLALKGKRLWYIGILKLSFTIFFFLKKAYQLTHINMNQFFTAFQRHQAHITCYLSPIVYFTVLLLGICVSFYYCTFFMFIYILCNEDLLWISEDTSRYAPLLQATWVLARKENSWVTIGTHKLSLCKDKVLKRKDS